MPALIDLRRRIKSVRNTQQITLAMKNVATAKFKRSQRVVLERRPYWHSYPDLCADVASWAWDIRHPLLDRRQEKSITGLVLTSDKGLCGAFNSNLLARALEFFKQKANSCEVHLVLVGKKAFQYFRKHPFPVKRAYTEQIQALTRLDLKELAQFLMRDFVFQRTDAVYAAYNEFKSILAPALTVAKVLPLQLRLKEAVEDNLERVSNRYKPDWEPGMLPLLNSILPLYVETQIRHFYFESSAAEQAARMMAMDNATKNAGELIEDLTLILNKIRQAAITKELLEIMSAVEALAKK